MCSLQGQRGSARTACQGMHNKRTWPALSRPAPCTQVAVLPPTPHAPAPTPSPETSRCEPEGWH